MLLGVFIVVAQRTVMARRDAGLFFGACSVGALGTAFD